MGIDAEVVKFGGVGMIRGMCPDCGSMALISNGFFLCCDRAVVI